ncbi:MAG: endonuclease MutS2 [Phycisphaerae bacterium]
MNDATLQKLEFDEIRETLAICCGTALGKRLARSMTPSTKTGVVREWLNQVRELAIVAEECSLPPMGGIHDIREYVRASAFPAPLEADALAQVAETLGATASLRAWFTRIGDAAPSLQALGEQIDDLSPIAEAINEAIDPRGKVRDYASPKLASIRSAIAEAHRHVRRVFDRILRQSSFTRMLQYSGATFHNDRMVLPLKAEHRGRIPGIIHRSSDTGATLFVEPAESVELNNTIVRLRDSEGKEITRILRELTQHVQVNAKDIVVTLRAIAVVDVISAKCRYARKRSCICPEIDENGVMDLHAARHPVLIELFEREALEGAPFREVVPIDIRVGDDFDVLVITGPNTGGKTVAIKTVGLMMLMTQCGIPIPAGEGSRMPVYRQVFIDVGDEQSLQQSLSTFSSHLAALLNIIRHSGPRSLVLIDELGAGTDPDEGAAIGQSIVSELLKLKAKAVVTTHLSVLKAIAYTTARVDNAAVDFDPESLKPTFHVRMGEPGNSNALIIAKRLGMPSRLVKLAKWFLDDRTRALNKAIAGTLRSRREAEEARRTAHEAALESQRERDRYEEGREELERSRKTFEEWTRWINALKPGDGVYIKPLKRPAKVVRMELHKQKALVSAGAMDIEVPLRDIDPP